MQMIVSRVSRSNQRLALFGILLVGLAACGGGGGGAALGIGSMGSVFQQAFSQGPNDAPLELAGARLRVNLTAEPFEL